MDLSSNCHFLIKKLSILTGRISDLVDVVSLEKLCRWDSVKTKPCRVELVRLQYTQTVKLPTLQTNQDLLDLGEYFTCSKSKPKKLRRSKRPRKTNTNIYYEESASSGELTKNKKLKKTKPVPPVEGPTAARICAQTAKTETPTIRLPALEVDTTEDQSIKPVQRPAPSVEKSEKDIFKSKIKGSFATHSFVLKKQKRHRKYGCKLCTEIVDSAHLLTIHHRVTHGILYCETCNKAFNNPTSLVRHSYQHKPLHFHCTCGASFAFTSQLQTHSVVHRCHASHHCVYPKCNKFFKNKGDLKRHADGHYSEVHECPDCDYTNSDIRNLESHRLKHSDIINYTCNSCGEGFKYNTQFRRHKNNPKKCHGPKRSNSPEF